MLTFFVGLAIGAVVGITAVCLLVVGKEKDRLDVSSSHNA